MTPREHVRKDLEIGERRLAEALSFLDDPEIDIWRSIAAIRLAEEHLARAREELSRVSREALKMVLDGSKGEL